jgi:hypothetical protein
MQDPNPAAPLSPTPVIDLREKLIEVEYGYLTQSSFHSDELRNQVIQFYLVIASAVATAVLALAQFQTGGAPKAPAVQGWVFSAATALVGLVGLALIPIFVRLRLVVLECLQGTVLLKRYVFAHAHLQGDALLPCAMLWDDGSLPTDERYNTASFGLVFVVLLLDAAMFAMALALVSPPMHNGPLRALPFGSFLLTFEVCLYRYLLWRALNDAGRRDGLAKKLQVLGIPLDPKKHTPQLRAPLWKAVKVGGAVTLALVVLAWLV